MDLRPILASAIPESRRRELADLDAKKWTKEAKRIAEHIFAGSVMPESKLYPFRHQWLNKYSMSVVPNDQPDDDVEVVPEHKYHLQYDFFTRNIHSAWDVLFIFLHAEGHRILLQFWEQTKIDRSSFPQPVIHLIEDMYSQYFFSQYGFAEELVSRVMYFKFLKPYQHKRLRESMYSLIHRQCDHNLPRKLRAIHHYLYNERPNPNQIETFDLYMRYWFGVYQDPDIKEMLDKFELVGGNPDHA